MWTFYPALAEKMWRINAHDHQWPPTGDWTTWLIIGGRGAGKTRAGAEWVRAVTADNDNMYAPQGASKRCLALVAETYADAREVMIEGPSGICAVAADAERPAYEASRRRLVWPSGAVAYAFSAEDPDGLRGYQFDGAWSDAFQTHGLVVLRFIVSRVTAPPALLPRHQPAR